MSAEYHCPECKGPKSPAAKICYHCYTKALRENRIPPPKPGTGRKMKAGVPGRTANKILRWIVAYIETNGLSPTYREIGVGCDIASSSTVHGHIHTLEKLGFIAIDHGRFRSIRLAGKLGEGLTGNAESLIISYRNAAAGNSFFDAINKVADEMMHLIKCTECGQYQRANTRKTTDGGSEIPEGLCKYCGNDWLPF